MDIINDTENLTVKDLISCFKGLLAKDPRWRKKVIVVCYENNKGKQIPLKRIKVAHDWGITWVELNSNLKEHIHGISGKGYRIGTLLKELKRLDPNSQFCVGSNYRYFYSVTRVSFVENKLCIHANYLNEDELKDNHKIFNW